MTISTKKLFTLIICLLLLPQSIAAMKRDRTGNRIRGGKRPNLGQSNAIIPTTLHELIWQDLPQDLWISVVLEDLSNLKTLRQTSSDINKALSIVTLDYLDSTMTQHPGTAKIIAENFYICTEMLFRYGKQQDKNKFNMLWNSQSVNDKGIRAHFVRENYNLTYDIKKESDSPFQVFAHSGTEKIRVDDKRLGSFMNYLNTALHKHSPQSVHLATSFAFHNKITLDSSKLTLNDIRTTPGPIFFLIRACQHSTIECLHMLLELGIDPGIKPEKHYAERRSVLHFILGCSGEIIVDNKAEKIELILHYYNKIYANKNLPQKDRLVNRICDRGTPLSCAIDMFALRIISLDELIDIINVLLKYGADTKIPIYKNKRHISNHTVFDKIARKQTAISIDPITQEEADIIIGCLNGKQ